MAGFHTTKVRADSYHNRIHTKPFEEEPTIDPIRHPKLLYLLRKGMWRSVALLLKNKRIWLIDSPRWQTALLMLQSKWRVAKSDVLIKFLQVLFRLLKRINDFTESLEKISIVSSWGRVLQQLSMFSFFIDLHKQPSQGCFIIIIPKRKGFLIYDYRKYLLAVLVYKVVYR